MLIPASKASAFLKVQLSVTCYNKVKLCSLYQACLFLSAVYPDLSSRHMEVDVAYINRCVGVSLGADEIAQLLSRMALAAEASSGGELVSVEIPPSRSDILHPCDIMEVCPVPCFGM